VIAQIVVQAYRPLEQARVQVEDVARVRLAARRPPQEQRHLAIRVRVLRQVVVNAERVLAVVEEMFAHGAPGIGRHVLDRRRLVGSRGNDDRVLHRAVLLEHLHHLHHRGHALPDRDVDADEVLVLVVDDRVDGDRGLPRLAVADDQLALATADRDHPVNRLETRLNGSVDRLALHDARRLELRRPGLVRRDVPLVVEGPPERIHHPSQQSLSHGDLEQVAGAFDGVALDDVVPLPEQDDADVVLLQVQREPGHVVGQLEHLERHAVVQAVDARDPVGHREHGPDLRQVGALGLQTLDPLAQDARYLVRLDLHVYLAP
jgi:hypothetical protein